MPARGDPPEGTPEDVPGPGGEEEYRSVVFDESFVRAARILEYSAQERSGPEARPVRTVGPRREGPVGHSAARQVYAIVLLVAVALGVVVFMGRNNPYEQAGQPSAGDLRMSVTPLVPRGPVPAASENPDARSEGLFAGSPAADYRSGAEGITLPGARATAHFTEDQVLRGLVTVKDFLVASSIDPGALTGGDVRGVRTLLDPGQHDQFDRSLEAPEDDGRHLATGWMVRFDPARTELADPRVRVRGTLEVREAAGSLLQIEADHTYVYAVRPAGGKDGGEGGEPSLFAVRRAITFQLTREDLRDGHVVLVRSVAEAGPQACEESFAEYYRPLPAGAEADGRGGTDPYDHGRPVAAACGVLVRKG
ncbi:hypothetical protein GCM10010406_02700 [Streptomyces thermolineatus]|uniref:Uncharacterized protein n=1 Tax=Streptomyces thermolineatus TaxID=44033 RepID=A0ABN2VQX5_9ACTN